MLDKNEIQDAFHEAEQNVEEFFEPFDEFERLAANKIRDDLPDNYPRVNDGSLAALMFETPMRVLPHPISGVVKLRDRDEEWLRELANILWNRHVIPGADSQASFFIKWQVALYKALIYGSQPIFDFFSDRGMYRGPDFVLPYIRDVILEPGKVSDKDSDYIFMKNYYTKVQLRRILEKTKEMDKAGIDNPWDANILGEIIDQIHTLKTDKEKNREERDKNVDTKGAKLVTCFQRGEESQFYTFVPDLSSAEDLKIARTATNTNPTGDVPIHFLYSNQDLENPYGRGQIEVAGATQNVLDHLTQADILSTQIGLEPPIEIKGNKNDTNLESMVFARRQFWFTGQAEIKTHEPNTSLYSQFPNRYGMYKTQLLSLQGTTDASVSAESGDPSFSKTHSGVELQKERVNTHDNFLRRRVFDAYNRVASSMLNQYFANMEGQEVMKLTEDESEKLKKAGLIDEDPESETQTIGEITLVWDNMRAELDFEVDSSADVPEEEKEQLQSYIEIMRLTLENPQSLMSLKENGWDLDLGEVYKRILQNIGVSDWEKLLKEVEPQQMDNQQIGQQAPQADPARVKQLMQNHGMDQAQAEKVAAGQSQQASQQPQQLAQEMQQMMGGGNAVR